MHSEKKKVTPARRFIGNIFDFEKVEDTATEQLRRKWFIA
jgi:hypothetical protein